MVQPINPQPLPLQPAAPPREPTGIAAVLGCIARVVAAVAHFFFDAVRSIFCCCGQKSLEERAIQEIPKQNRGAVQEIANRLFDAAHFQTPPVYLSDFRKSTIIKLIDAIPVAERPAVVPLLERTILDGKVVRIDDLIRSVIAIDAPQKEEAIQCALILIHRDTSLEDRRLIIEAIAKIPPDQRREAAERTLQISPPYRPWVEERTNRIAILKGLMAIPAVERWHVIYYVRRLITPEMYAHDIIGIMEDVARQPAYARPDYVLRRIARERDFQLPPRPQFPVRDRNGGAGAGDNNNNANLRTTMQDVTNVHEGDRDLLVKNAVEKLYRDQGPIDEVRLVNAVNAFVDYLYPSKDFSKIERDPAQKTLAINALQLKIQPGESFGPLIDREGFIIKGWHLYGLELIGRLWIFTEQIKDETDQINAKEGMIGALVDSYDSSMERVCNGGKTQRLVLKVLQGRLAGVNIDKVEISKVVPTEDAMTDFFTNHPENQKIVDFNILKKKADQYLAENPNIDKKKFIAAIISLASDLEMANLPKED